MVSKAHLQVTCRRVGRNKVDELMALEESCFQTDRIARRNLIRLLRSPSAACIGAFCGKEMVGSMVLLFRRGTRVGRIYSLAVAPAFRGRGVAGCLLARAAREARARKCQRLRLEVRHDNLVAIQLYRHHRFAEAGTRTEYYEDGADALLMEKNLD